MSTSGAKGPKDDGSPKSPKDDPSKNGEGSGNGKGNEIPFNYDHLNSSNSYISVPSRRAPYFDGTHYAAWRHKIKLHLISLHSSIKRLFAQILCYRMKTWNSPPNKAKSPPKCSSLKRITWCFEP